MGRSLFHFQEKPKQLGRANAILRVMFAWESSKERKNVREKLYFHICLYYKKYSKKFNIN